LYESKSVKSQKKERKIIQTSWLPYIAVFIAGIAMVVVGGFVYKRLYPVKKVAETKKV